MTSAAVDRLPGNHHPDHEHHKSHEVKVTCDYLSADEPIERLFLATDALTDVKAWALSVFVPHPPSDKTYWLSDDKTRQRFTTAQERETLAQLGYKHEAHLRLHEEQVSGRHAI